MLYKELCLPVRKDEPPKINTVFGSFVIKPDTHILHLSEPLIADIMRAGFEVLFRKELQVTPDMVEQLYPDYLNDPLILPAAKCLFGLGPSTLLLVTLSDPEPQQSVFEKIKQSKGKARQGGLRDKYIRDYQEDLIAKGFEGQSLVNEVAKNRLHGPDDDEQHTKALKALITAQDITKIRRYHQGLYEHVATKVGIW